MSWPTKNEQELFKERLITVIAETKFELSGCICLSNEKRQVGYSASLIFRGDTTIEPTNIQLFKAEFQRISAESEFNRHYRSVTITLTHSDLPPLLLPNDTPFDRVQIFFVPKTTSTPLP